MPTLSNLLSSAVEKLPGDGYSCGDYRWTLSKSAFAGRGIQGGEVGSGTGSAVLSGQPDEAGVYAYGDGARCGVG
jgi:hypothetical protein